MGTEACAPDNIPGSGLDPSNSPFFRGAGSNTVPPCCGSLSQVKFPSRHSCPVWKASPRMSGVRSHQWPDHLGQGGLGNIAVLGHPLLSVHCLGFLGNTTRCPALDPPKQPSPGPESSDQTDFQSPDVPLSHVSRRWSVSLGCEQLCHTSGACQRPELRAHIVTTHQLHLPGEAPSQKGHYSERVLWVKILPLSQLWDPG